MIKTLHIVSSLRDNGGVQKLLYTYAGHLSNEVQFDFMVHEYADSQLLRRFKEIGSNIYPIKARKDVGLKEYLRVLKKTIKELPPYDVIHIHIGYKSCVPLHYCKKYFKDTPVIVHIHSAIVNDSLKERIMKDIAVRYIKLKADDFFACGQKAGIYFYGEKFFKKHNVFVMPNAIATDEYIYNEEKRNAIRSQFGIENNRVYGHVGTFYYPKNHEFLIDIFQKLYKKDKNARLLLVGNGELLENIREKVRCLNLEDVVFFAGVRQNVADFLSAFDYFILPSIYEGVPVSIVEAQSSGLKCFVSDSVTREVNICEDISYISLGDAVKWANTIVTFSIPNSKTRLQKNIEMKESIYNIENSALLLLNRYIKLIGKEDEIN